jgi:activator of HSP90 ATPase
VANFSALLRKYFFPIISQYIRGLKKSHCAKKNCPELFYWNVLRVGNRQQPTIIEGGYMLNKANSEAGALAQSNCATKENDKPSKTVEQTRSGSSVIHLEATFPATPERVYELLTNGAKFGDVTGHPGKGGGAVGAYFSLFNGWLEGRQIELVSNEMITQAWRFGDWEKGIYSMVRFKLIPEGNGTKLVLDQDGVPASVHEHVKTNWEGFYFAPFRKHFATQS